MKRGLIFFLILATLGVLSQTVRQLVGVDFGVESTRAWIDSFGWWGPLAFVTLYFLRYFLLIPSTILLTVAGLCFGTLLGSAVGAVAVILTSILEFQLMRTLRPAWLVRRSAKAGRVSRAVHRSAPLAVGIATAVPPTPYPLFHFAAALTTIPFTSFLLVASVGAVIRSFSLAFFGAGLLATDPIHLLASLAVVAVLLAIPMAHPTLRRTLRPAPESPAPPTSYERARSLDPVPPR